MRSCASGSYCAIAVWRAIGFAGSIRSAISSSISPAPSTISWLKLMAVSMPTAKQTPGEQRFSKKRAGVSFDSGTTTCWRTPKALSKRSFACCRKNRPSPTDRCQRLADCGADLGGLAFEGGAEAAHLAAQAVELIEQPEHQRHRLVVDREFAADLEDQLDPRDVNLMEQPAPACLIGQDPTVLDPAPELDAVERGEAPGQFVEADHEAAALSAVPGSRPIARRGSAGCFSAQPLMNSASSASPLAPIITLSVTYWSPVVSLPRRLR